MADFDIGDMIRFTCTFTDAAGAPADPTSVTFKLYKTHTSATADYSATSTPPIVKAATGSYYIDIGLDVKGVYAYRWEGDGAVTAAGEGTLKVAGSYFA